MGAIEGSNPHAIWLDEAISEIWKKPLNEQLALKKPYTVFPSYANCWMCGESLSDDDLLPYHTPKKWTDIDTKEPKMKGKDCTPSCMYCAKVFGSKKALEEHEEGCI